MIIQMPARTYTAKLFESPFESASFMIAGTLDGFIDLAVPGGGTYVLNVAEAKQLAKAITEAVSDVTNNCFYERDSLLE